MKHRSYLFILCLILPIFAVHTTTLFVKNLQFGDNVPLFIQQRMQYWINQKSTTPADITLSIFLGNTSTTNQWISSQELSSIKSEGFIVKSKSYSSNNVTVVMNGNWNEEKTYPQGVVYGCYTVLEKYLGIYFSSHPMNISLQNEPHFLKSILSQKDTVITTESPFWRIRGIHIHTEHPLELNELLNGFISPDFQCHTCKNEEEVYQAQVTKEWLPVCEWLVANKQNRVEWVLLYAKHYAQFAESVQRQNRLMFVANTAQQFGLKVGIDAAIFITQQHDFALIRNDDTMQPMDQLRKRLTFIMKGMDFFSTELGFTEFTHGDVELMLQTLNESARFCDEELGHKKSYVKIHISQGQYIDTFADPQTQKPPMNFNFLPHYSDPRMGIMPHTVQLPALDDPAFSYGNTNFSFMGEFMFFESKLKQREVIWYPETAYWVTYDINVPLFLPVYIYRRLYDLDKIIQRQAKDNIEIDGQVIFSSGWEFGYWLNDVIVMRSAWNPHSELSLEDRVAYMLKEVTLGFSKQEKESTALASILQVLMKEQFETLIFGNQFPNASQVEKKSGIAYLQGIDTWDEVSILVDELTGRSIETNPRYVGLFEVKLMGGSSDKKISYVEHVRPVLLRMHESFTSISSKIDALSIFYEQSDSFQDISLSMKLLSLRAYFQFSLYEYAYGFFTKQPQNWKLQQRQLLLNILNTTTAVMHEKLQYFRFSLERVASWRVNPTSYQFTYLWHAKTLFYWWRSFVKFEYEQMSPCFMNIINPVDVAVGEGLYNDVVQFLKQFLEEHKWIPYISECLSAPSKEPVVPPFPVSKF